MVELEYILVIIVAFIISPFLNGLVNKFVEEDKQEEELERQKEKQTPITKSHKDEKENKEKNTELVRVKMVPSFDWKVAGITVLTGAVLVNHFGICASFFVYSFLTCLLIICMFADIRGHIIPNEVNFVGFLVGISLAFIRMNIDVKAGIDSIAGMLVGFLIFLSIAGLSWILFKREGMGGGDIKLMGVIGLYVGFMNTIQVFILSFFIAAIVSIFLIATRMKKSDEYIAFGPFIVMATFLTVLLPASVAMPAILNWIR